MVIPTNGVSIRPLYGFLFLLTIQFHRFVLKYAPEIPEYPELQIPEYPELQYMMAPL